MEDIYEDGSVATTSGDVAIQPGVIGQQHRGLQCFKIDCESTFNGMSKGTKTKFKHWKKITQSPEIANWVKKNKDNFYIEKDNRFILIKRY